MGSSVGQCSVPQQGATAPGKPHSWEGTGSKSPTPGRCGLFWMGCLVPLADVLAPAAALHGLTGSYQGFA